MATYQEIFDLANNTALRERVAVACLVAAEVIRAEVNTTPNNANRLAWARRAFEAPMQEASRMLPAVLSQNRTLTVAQITGAADNDLQTAVNAAVNVFATGA